VRDSCGIDVGVQSAVVCHTVRVDNALTRSAHPAEVYDEVQAFTEVVLPWIVLENVLRLASDREVRAHPVCVVDHEQFRPQRIRNDVKRAINSCKVLDTGHRIVPRIRISLRSDFVGVELGQDVRAQVSNFVCRVVIVSYHHERE